MRYLTFLMTAALVGAALAAPASADLRPPAREYTLEGNRLVLPGPMEFKAGTAELLPASTKNLNVIAGYLKDKAYISLMRIEGHVDSSGSGDAGQRLSEQRALAVTKALVKQGVECKRLLPVGFGATKPVAANDSAEGRAKNQRIDAVNAELRGRAIGGMAVDGGGKAAGDPCK